MNIAAVKTELIYPKQQSLLAVIDKSIPTLAERTVVVISSKIVSLCEGNFVDPTTASKDELIKQNAQFYLERDTSKYKTILTITKNSLMLAAGIDESNSAGTYVLWPKNPLETAKDVYEHLVNKYKIANLGVIIVDSTSRPLRLGTIGTAIAHYGFSELHDYRGTKDLFDHTMTISRSNIAEGLASASILAMGEGIEQTPLAIITDIPFVTFGSQHFGSCYAEPTDAYKDDIYEPLWNSVDWKKGEDKL